ncbi:hypothetical protein N7527_009341 [Penicillium freii]|nr:hypothetical protein N7527_009341 [Penicillium freii]
MSPPPEESHYDDLVIHILTEIVLSEQSIFKKVDLERLGITVDRFEAIDSNFLDDRKKCLFKPFHQELIKRWKIPDSAAAYESVYDRLAIQDVPCNSRLASNLSEAEIADATADVIVYLKTNMRFLCEGRTLKNLPADTEDYYYQRLVDTLGRPSLEWWTKDSSDSDILAGPSTQIVISTDGIGKEDRVLLSELGAIVQVTTYRRIQPGFSHYYIFPACYDRYSLRLELRILPIFSFLEKNNESFDLFLRFMASSPPEILDLDLSELSLES